MRGNDSLPSFILLLSCLIGVMPIQSAKLDVADDEYKVYSVLLKAKYSADDRKTFVIIKTTFPNEMILPGADDQIDILKKLAPLTEETLKNYNTLKNTQRELSDRFHLKTKIVLVDEKVIDAMFRQDMRNSWEIFYRKYPDSGGFIKLSRVGFNAKRTQALVFVSHNCGGRCASGTYYLLDKENNEWKIKKEHLIWVS